MTEDEIAQEMESFIRSAPRSWKELLQHFNGQNYRDVIVHSGGRPKLGRTVQPPYFPYAFSEFGGLYWRDDPGAADSQRSPAPCVLNTAEVVGITSVTGDRLRQPARVTLITRPISSR